MTLAAPFPIPPLLGGMADAMAEIRQMLLRYEEAMVAAPLTPENRRAVQDFDLAVQLLQDLEHIAQLLAVDLPQDLMAHNALPLAGLRLDRSRRHFVAAIARDSAELPPGTDRVERRVDLFVHPAEPAASPPTSPPTVPTTGPTTGPPPAPQPGPSARHDQNGPVR